MNIVGYVAEIREYNPCNSSIVHTDRDGKVSVLIHVLDSFSITYPAGMNLIPINKS